MKKLMALCLSLLMALSMCSFTAMAEEAATFEDISSEPANFVTANLTLGEHTITSSNEAVIALDGTVTRPFLGDETVTLTIDGGESFNVTVKDQTATPIVNEGFSTDGAIADYGWAISGYSTAETNYVEGGEMHVNMDASGTNKRTYLDFKPTVPADGIVRVAMDINDITNISGTPLYDADGNPIYKEDKVTQNTTSAGIDVSLYFTATNADGTTTAVSDKRIVRIGATGFAASGIGSNDGISFKGTKLEFKYDSATGDIWVSNGNGVFTKLAENIITDYAANATSVKLSQIRLLGAGDYYVGDFDIDSLSIYKEISADALIGNLTDAERVAYYKNLILESTITSNGSLVGVRDDLTLMESPAEVTNTTITWTSSDTSVITDDGAVTLADSFIPKNVTMTATITAGEETDTVSFPLQVAQANTTAVHANDYETETTISNASYVADDASHKTAIYMINETGNEIKSGAVSQTNVTYFDRVLASVDVKYSRLNGIGNHGIFKINGIQGADSFNLYINYNTNKIGLGSSHSSSSGTTAVPTAGTAGTVPTSADSNVAWFPMPESVAAKEGEWVNYVFDINILSQSYYIYADGQLVNETPVIRQSAYKTNTNATYALRSYSFNLSQQGEIYVDNVTWCKFNDTDAVEVNAALNAALILQAAEHIHPTMTNQTLLSKTISKSWSTGTDFIKDTSDTINNPGRYTLQADGPTITYKIDGVDATEINVSSPRIAEVTFTATSADGTITESKTITKQLAPVGIRDLGLGTNSCLNGIWFENTLTGTEKVVVAQYIGSTITNINIYNLAEELEAGSFSLDTMVLQGISGVNHPNYSNTTQVKIFVLDADGITPLTIADTRMHD